MRLVNQAHLARELGVSADSVRRMRQAKKISGRVVGRRELFNIEEVRAQIAALPPSRADASVLTCYLCKRQLPADAFPTITVRDKRGKPGYSHTGPSSDCRGCRKAQRREWRARKAQAAGKAFSPRGDREAYEEACRRRRAAERATSESRRSEEVRARREERSALDRLAQSATYLTCSKCGIARSISEFHPSQRVHGWTACKTCWVARDAVKFANDRALLTDVYVKRQLYKKSGLKHTQIPQILVEAERARLMVQRVVGPWKQPSGQQRRTRKAA